MFILPFIDNPRQFRLRLAKDYAWGNPPEKYDVKLELYLNLDFQFSF